MRALIVDDNQINLKIADAMLKRLGFHSTTAADGTTALKLIAREPYPLVLIDYQMPVMNGVDVTREIRRIERDMQRTSAVLIATSAAFTAEIRRDFDDAGISHHLMKPFLVEELRKCLASYFFIMVA